MKALSLKEPWASLVLEGKKTIETRKWTTDYRGKILICASLKPSSQLAGFAFATAELVDCRPMTREDEAKACCPVYDRANAWILEGIVPLEVPFKVKGQLGLFDVDIPTELSTAGLGGGDAMSQSQTPLSSFGIVKDHGEQRTKPGFDADGKRHDCCFKGCGTSNETCFIQRCYPNGEAEPQCATCQPAKCYVNQFIGFRTAAEIMAGGR